MSRILKRPMFRKGGEVMEGIMTGIKSRTNYADGKTREEIISSALENLSPSSQGYAQSFMDLAKLGGTSNKDLLTNVLIQGGLRGMSQTGGGGTLGNLAKAFEEPVAGALKQRSANQQLDISGAMKGLGLGIERDIAMAKQNKEKIFESGTIPGITKQIMSALGKNALTEDAQQLAVNLAPKIARIQQAEIKNPNILYQGILQMDDNDPSQPDLNWVGSQPDGAVFINPYDRIFYIKDGDQLLPADQRTYGKPAKKEG
jgi:hypothetical protein